MHPATRQRRGFRPAVLLMLCSVLACRQAGTVLDKPGTDDRARDEPAVLLRHAADSALLSELRRISPQWTSESVHVYSPGSMDSGNAMSGVALGEDLEAFFAPFYPLDQGPDVFAVGWLSIGPGFEGFVLRVPSRYSATELDMWTYDLKGKHWLRPWTIADAFGDAGWSFQMDAWLVDRNADGYRDVLQHRTDEDWDLEDESAGAKVVADSAYWTFFQSSFSDWGWRDKLSDAEKAKLVLQAR